MSSLFSPMFAEQLSVPTPRSFDTAPVPQNQNDIELLDPIETLDTVQDRRTSVRQWMEYIASSYTPPPEKDVLLLYPCASTKPMLESKTYRALFDTFSRLGDSVRDRVHVVTVSEPMTLIPLGFHDGEYPVRGEWVSRILIGGLLGLFSFLIIPAVIINGYLIEVLRGTVNENDTPPSFTETGWGTLFVEGLMAFLIILAYSFIPMVLYFLTTWLFIGTGSAIGGNAGAALSGIGMLAFLVIIPFMLVIYYLIPAALTNYAVHDDIHAAFDFQTIKQVVLTSEYFIAMLLPIVVGIGIGVVGLILAITIVGVLLIPFLQFYAQLSIYRIFGEAYKQTAPQLQ